MLDIHWIIFGSAWVGKKIPDISISGKDIINENNTAIPSLFAINPMIRPSEVLMIPIKRIRCAMDVGEITYEDPVSMKSVIMIRNWTATSAVKNASFASM